MDESFVNYHLHSNKTDELFWKDWIASHPEKKELVKKAQELIDTLSITLSEEEYQEELAKITAAINKTDESQVFALVGWNRRQQLIKRRKALLFMVPVSLVLLFAAYFLVNHFQKAPAVFSQTTNTGTNSMEVTLSDST